MRVSYEWLKGMVDVPADPQGLITELVRTGTEVAAVERIAFASSESGARVVPSDVSPLPATLQGSA